MAFSVAARQSAPNTGSATGNLVTASATPTANALYLVCVGAQMDAFGTETLPVFATPTGGSLTYTKVDSHGDVTPGYLWGSTNGYWTGGAVYRAPIGGSPSAFAVTVDGAGGSTTAYHSAVCLDITGHNISTPIVPGQVAHNGARINPESSSTAGSVTLPAPPTAGNLIVVAFMCGTDTAGAVASPTAGAGKTFTTVTAQSPAFCTTGVFYRVADGTESATITTSDLGQLVGNYVAIAFEVAAASTSITGSGTATAPTAQAAGTAAVAVTGTGSSTAPAAVASGTGTIGDPQITGSGEAVAPAASVAGAAAAPVTATGTPTAPLATAAGAGTVTVTGSGTATAPAAVVAGHESAHRYVTGVSANGRYFVDQSGAPILVRGESPWSMFTDLSPSEMDTYLTNRAGYGCNLALVSMIGAVANGGPADTGATYDGILPFTGGNPTVFNEAYWSRMDAYIQAARDAGITLMIYPMDGWNTAFASVVFNPGSISNAQCQTYGQTLATRYLSYPNIIWAFGGDYNEDATINARFNACLTGIRAAGDTRPASVQLLYETSESHNSSFWEPKVNYDWVYTYYVTYKGVSDAYNWTWSASPTARPALFAEGAYENSNAPHNGTDTALRRQACWALTSGSPGELTGQEGVWNFLSGWASLLNTTAADQIKAIRDTFEALDWWTLVPDDANQLVTAGRGTRITTDSATFPSGNNYVTAARSVDATLAVIYMPNAASAITVDMSKIGANPTATWVDPTTGGTVSATPGSSYSRGNNAAGATDWLLILTGDPVVSTGSGTATAPQATAAGVGTVRVAGGGGVSAPAAAATGAASVRVVAAGDISAPAAALTGVAAAVVAGSGSVAAPAGVVAGTGNIGDPIITGNGDSVAPAAAVAGIGGVVVAGAGAVAAPVAEAAGSAGVAVSGAGGVAAVAASVAGVGSVRVDGAGSAIAPAAVVAGAGGPLPEDGYTESVLTVSNSPSSHLEVSHGV